MSVHLKRSLCVTFLSILFFFYSTCLSQMVNILTLKLIKTKRKIIYHTNYRHLPVCVCVTILKINEWKLNTKQKFSMNEFVINERKTIYWMNELSLFFYFLFSLPFIGKHEHKRRTKNEKCGKNVNVKIFFLIKLKT